MLITLTRLAYLPTGTLGKLTVGDETFFTIERPWLGNKPFESCIPEGIYRCKRYSSAKYPDTFEITGVPGRSAILFHVANYPDDVQGCVGVGTDLLDVVGVGSSIPAFKKFLHLLRDIEEFDIRIMQYRPEYP